MEILYENLIQLGIEWKMIIMWIIGGRISNFYKVNEATEKVIEIKYIRRNKNG